jgi:FdhD protein
VSERPHAQTPVRVRAVSREGSKLRSDVLATEEPLEIRVNAGAAEKTIAITMRTPGNDFELAAGFLYGEGVVDSRGDFDAIRYCMEPELQQYNVVTVDLSAAELPELGSLDRHFYTTSACGVCGKANLDAVEAIGGPVLGDGPIVSSDVILSLPDRLQQVQRVFSKTGGLHAVALFDPSGEIVEAREDVGRHNAMDKLVGWGVLERRLPFTDHIVLVSGRASFELVQKALRAGVSMVCAISAPSSLAVDVAERFGMTLVGFLRQDGFNVYANERRVNTRG